MTVYHPSSDNASRISCDHVSCSEVISTSDLDFQEKSKYWSCDCCLDNRQCKNRFTSKHKHYCPKH